MEDCGMAEPVPKQTGDDTGHKLPGALIMASGGCAPDGELSQ
jgi:hypothetical protein